MSRRPIRPVLPALLLALAALSSCDLVDSVKDGVKQSDEAAAAIEKQLGTKPQVGFNYRNGSFASATVIFATPPHAALAEIEQASRDAVLVAFKKEPDQLVVSFVYPRKS